MGGGRRSTAIIRRLEAAHPDPPLCPADPAERQGVPALEDYFDEELGPYVRRMIYHDLARDPELPPRTRRPSNAVRAQGTMAVAERGLKLFLDLSFSTANEASPMRRRARPSQHSNG